MYLDKLLGRSLREFQFSSRMRKCFSRRKLSTIGDLVECTPNDLLDTKNFGLVSLAKVREFLVKLGLNLRGDPPAPSPALPPANTLGKLIERLEEILAQRPELFDVPVYVRRKHGDFYEYLPILHATSGMFAVGAVRMIGLIADDKNIIVEDGATCPECGKGKLIALTRTEEFDFDLGEKIVKVCAENVPVQKCDACGEVLSGPMAAEIRRQAICRSAGVEQLRK